MTFEQKSRMVSGYITNLHKHSWYKILFFVLYMTCAITCAIAVFYCMIGLSGQSDFESMYGSLDVTEIHSTSYFVFHELVGMLVVAVSYLGVKVFDYLFWVQTTYTDAFQHKIRCTLDSMEREVEELNRVAAEMESENARKARELGIKLVK